MTDTENQVPEADTQPQGASTADPVEPNSEPSVDDLLNEFNAPEPDPGQTPTPSQTPDISKEKILELIERDEARTQKERLESTNKGISSSVSMVKEYLEESGVEATDKVINGLMQAHALEDPRFNQAFMNRDANPQAWGKVLSAFAKDVVAKELGQTIDPSVTANKQQLRNAMKGSQSVNPQTPEQEKAAADKKYLDMPSDEFNREYEKITGLNNF